MLPTYAEKVLIPADYILFDSWFALPKTLITVQKLGYDVIAMIKRSEKMTFLYKDKKRSLKEIYTMNRKRRGRSKYLLSVVVDVEKDGTIIPAKVVYVRNCSNRKDYLCLISTNVNIDEEEIIRIYSKRWQIEVFFKMCKKLSQAGKGMQVPFLRCNDSSCCHRIYTIYDACRRKT